MAVFCMVGLDMAELKVGDFVKCVNKKMTDTKDVEYGTIIEITRRRYPIHVKLINSNSTGVYLKDEVESATELERLIYG